MSFFSTTMSIALFALCCGVVSAQAQAPDALERKARQILQSHCFSCHSHQAGKGKGQLYVDSRAALLKGGESGPALLPEDLAKSPLLAAVRYQDENLRMPPKGKLADEDLAALEAWVRAGAPWPDAPAAQATRPAGGLTDADRNYWAFRPVTPVAPPQVDLPEWNAHPIDRWVYDRLRKERLRPAAPAEPAALLRRLSFDLTGLPPTPDEVERFLRDCSQDRAQAYARAVDRLLDSPSYGERWAQHWLDVVRYAESDGYRLDAYRPHAWRYRDYVVGAFNADKPYDAFVREQLAGDELSPDNPAALAATGFLTLGIYEYNQRHVRAQWNEMLNEITDVASEAFLGLSLACARCHDHKFDPLLQKDYFGLRAFFEGLLPSQDLPMATQAQREDHAAKLAEWLKRTAAIRREIEAVEAPVRARVEKNIINKFPDDIREFLLKPRGQRSPLEHQLASLAQRQVDYDVERMDKEFKGEARERLAALRKALAQFEQDRPEELAVCPQAREVGPRAAPTLLPRKNTSVEPAFLTVLGDPEPAIEPPANGQSTGRRAALARWLTRPEHPLTARVMVNRAWQAHFGRGLVATANDFGHLGEPPTHPELLDWLADRFVRDGWSFKKLHRLIVTSQAYQQSCTPSDRLAQQKDPENRWLARMSARRLDAEQVRDAVLQVSGMLDLKAGGASVDWKQPRRSLYLKNSRNAKESLLGVFDLPEAFGSTAKRNVTTTSPQALLLLNSGLMREYARAFAGRVLQEASTDGPRVDRAFRLAYGRGPSPAELAQSTEFLAKQARSIRPAPAASDEVARIPFHDGRAAQIAAGTAQARFDLPADALLEARKFTLESFVMLRTAADDGTLRTIASHWDGDPKGQGWLLGVTGKKSAFKPQILSLLLWGTDAIGQPAYEPVFSGLKLEINRPYFVAVTVDLDDTSEGGITFYTKDLGNDDEPMLTSSATHKVVGMKEQRGRFTIGGTAGPQERTWDGLLDDVRLSREVLSPKRFLIHSESMASDTVGFWRFESTPGMLSDSSSNGLHLRRHGAAPLPAASHLDPRQAAWIDFCLVLLNSSEFLYVD